MISFDRADECWPLVAGLLGETTWISYVPVMPTLSRICPQCYCRWLSTTVGTRSGYSSYTMGHYLIAINSLRCRNCIQWNFGSFPSKECFLMLS